MKEDRLKKNLNSSGFPFQLAVESIIGSLSGWKVGRRECPWHNHDTGEKGFIDIIAENDSNSTLIVECKRVRDAEWIFLCSPNNLDRSHARFWINKAGGQAQAVGWYDGQVEPKSAEADFCAIMGQDHRKPLLENLASELVSATEAFASEEYPFFKDIPMSMSYFPVDSVGKPLMGTNLYLYTNNNPVNYIDPEGLEERKAGGYVFRKYLNDHDPQHWHVFKDGKELGRFDIENKCSMDTKMKVKGPIRKALRRAGLLALLLSLDWSDLGNSIGDVLASPIGGESEAW